MKQPKNPSKYVGIDVYLCGEKATIINVGEEFVVIQIHSNDWVIVKHQDECWGLIKLPGLVERLVNKAKKMAKIVALLISTKIRKMP